MVMKFTNKNLTKPILKYHAAMLIVELHIPNGFCCFRNCETQKPIVRLLIMFIALKVFCEIRARYTGGDWSNWIRSQKLYTGITVSKRENYE